jgi:3-deoxy-manno-octulosonate cytidylyltransferase (CMP-KDO synthetase)
MRTAIVIPARYASTRLPGKPLRLIAGRTMLDRVVGLARDSARDRPGTTVCVATDDARIGAHCDALGVHWLLTPASCRTGTDRAEAAVRMLAQTPDFVVNLQGDAPLTPPDFVSALIDSFEAAPADCVTPVTQLSWPELDALRDHKRVTPFSGTTVTFDAASGRAFWFSKSIIPALRNEDRLRVLSPRSPVYRHVGLYGFSRATLAAFVALPEGRFEAMEGLEQLRLLEHGHHVRCVPVDYRGRPGMSGVDSEEDIARAEALLAAAAAQAPLPGMRAP